MFGYTESKHSHFDAACRAFALARAVGMTPQVLRNKLNSEQPHKLTAPSEAVTSGDFADTFRPRYAVNVQLLDADGNPDKNTPEYPAVPLPVPGAGNDSGTFQFPPEGTLVEIGFNGGGPDKPFVRQTMPEGNSLPDVKPGEQLQ